MKVLALITARGGSKGLPGKNIRPFAGHPLLAWTVTQALDARLINRVVLSTDSREICSVAKDYGLESSELRPAHLALDNSSTIEVIDHVINNLNEKFDVLLLLQPTSPLRRSGDLDGMVKLLQTNWNTADGVVTVGPLHPSPFFSLSFENGLVTTNNDFLAKRRQDIPISYFSYGVGWAIKVDTFKNERSLYPKRLLGWPLSREQLFDIDDEIDFISAEATMNMVLKNDLSYLPKFRKYL